MDEPLLQLGMINDRILRERYYIPNKNREYFTDDLEFVKKYRKKLYELLTTIARSTVEYAPEIEVARRQLKVLCAGVTEFANNADHGNFMRRVVFVKNIATEIDEMVADVCKNAAHSTAEVVAGEGERLKDFLGYAASESLMRDGKYEQLEEELAKSYAGKFSHVVQDNFVNLIDPNDLTKDDALFLIGYVWGKREAASSASASFIATHCKEGVCSRDDCMYPTVCEFNSTKRSYDRTLSKYDDCLSALSSKWRGDFDPSLASKVAENFPDEKVAPLIRAVLEKAHLAEGKKFELTLTREQWLLVNEMAVKARFYQDIEDEEQPNLRNIKEIVAYIILHNLDFSPATGEEVSTDFVRSYFALCDKMKSAPAEKDPYLMSYAEMLKMYEKILTTVQSKEDGE